MKRKKLRKIIDANLGPMREALGLWDWKITTYYGVVPSGSQSASAEVYADPQYNRAAIHFNPDKIDKKSDALFSLQHELLHIVLAEMKSYVAAVERVTEDIGKPACEALDESRAYSEERLVLALERIFIGLEITPKQLAKRGKR